MYYGLYIIWLKFMKVAFRKRWTWNIREIVRNFAKAVRWVREVVREGFVEKTSFSLERKRDWWSARRTCQSPCMGLSDVARWVELGHEFRRSEKCYTAGDRRVWHVSDMLHFECCDHCSQCYFTVTIEHRRHVPNHRCKNVQIKI